MQELPARLPRTIFFNLPDTDNRVAEYYYYDLFSDFRNSLHYGFDVINGVTVHGVSRDGGLVVSNFASIACFRKAKKLLFCFPQVAIAVHIRS